MNVVTEFTGAVKFATTPLDHFTVHALMAMSSKKTASHALVSYL